MPSITDLKKQKKSQRVNVYIDGEFAFGISLEGILKRGLKVGKNIEAELVEQLKKETGFERVHDRVLRFATLRPRSEREIKMWLARKGVDEKIGQRVLEKLKGLKLIDDGTFSKWWVDQRNQFRPKSKRALFQELREKGIEKETIEEVLGQIDAESELELAKKVLAKKIKRLSSLPFKEKRERLLSFLGARGFSWDTATRAVDEVLQRE